MAVQRAVELLENLIASPGSPVVSRGVELPESADVQELVGFYNDLLTPTIVEDSSRPRRTPQRDPQQLHASEHEDEIPMKAVASSPPLPLITAPTSTTPNVAYVPAPTRIPLPPAAACQRSPQYSPRQDLTSTSAWPPLDAPTTWLNYRKTRLQSKQCASGIYLLVAHGSEMIAASPAAVSPSRSRNFVKTDAKLQAGPVDSRLFDYENDPRWLQHVANNKARHQHT